MRLLYNAEKTTTDEYRYTVNQGGELNIRVSNGSDRHVTIVFVNGKLDSVSHNLGDCHLRSKWYVYGAIAEKIKELESGYAS